jgi:hypothetical protein
MGVVFGVAGDEVMTVFSEFYGFIQFYRPLYKWSMIKVGEYVASVISIDDYKKFKD